MAREKRPEAARHTTFRAGRPAVSPAPTSSTRTWKVLAEVTTILITGPPTATVTKTARFPPVMFPTTLSAMKISTTTADGAMRANTEWFGSRGHGLRAGRRITTVTGPTFLPGVTHG